LTWSDEILQDGRPGFLGNVGPGVSLAKVKRSLSKFWLEISRKWWQVHQIKSNVDLYSALSKNL